MSTYPIKVHSVSFDHKSGTKSYHLTMIETSDGRAVFINRWGRKGQFGELQVTEGTVKQCWTAWEAKEKAKHRGGYSPAEVPRDSEALGPGELARSVGLALFNKMGAKAVSFLDPTFDTSGMRELDPPRTDEDGRVVNDTTRRAKIDQDAMERERQARARLEEDERNHAYDNHEFFGRF